MNGLLICRHFVDFGKIALGTDHSLLLKRDKTLWAAGRGKDGQLGDEVFELTVDRASFLKVVDGGARDAAAGYSYSLVVKRDGSVWATGTNEFGQFGDGSNTDTGSFVRVVVKGANAVAAGEWHSMVLMQDGSVWTAGNNDYGQLGGGSDILLESKSFAKVIASGTRAVAAGSSHSMVLKQDGSVWATGDNKFGQLGDGSNTDRDGFVQVPSHSAQTVVAGAYHSLIIKQDSSVWATGYNRYGQLGDGSTTDKNMFVKVVSSGATAVAAGRHHSLMLKQDGSLWATGRNQFGQLGGALAETHITGFVQVLSSGVLVVAAGGHCSMIFKQDGLVWAAGSNTFGQLGDGSKLDRKAFTRSTFFGLNGACRTLQTVIFLRTYIQIHFIDCPKPHSPLTNALTLHHRYFAAAI